MISISCSSLETARINPKAIAQRLLSKGGSQGSRGMFANWQDHIRSIHSKNIDPSAAFLNLQQSFLKFATNQANTTKQDYLLDHFYPYLEKFEKSGFSYLESKCRMKWYLVTDGKLGGELPYVVKHKSGFAAYYFAERNFNWKGELRFPLIQRYLSANNLGCEDKDIQVGIYCLEQDSFQLENFKSDDVEIAIEEAKGIFFKVIEEYNKGN